MYVYFNVYHQEVGLDAKTSTTQVAAISPCNPRRLFPSQHEPIQARWRAYATEARRARAHAAALWLQAAARGFVARRRCGKIRAALAMQAVSRGFVARRRYSRVLQEQEEQRAREAELRAREAAREAEEIRYIGYECISWYFFVLFEENLLVFA